MTVTVSPPGLSPSPAQREKAGTGEDDSAAPNRPHPSPPPQAGEGVLDQRLAPVLDNLRERSLYRVRRIVEGRHAVRMRVDGRDCINFCSNDYLGLAADPRIAEAAREAFTRVGSGSSGSALISGYNAEHRALEEELADFLGRPRALLFSTGWATNMGVLKALLGRSDAVIADELNHASLIDGARASGAEYLRVPHADLSGFERAAQQTAIDRRFTLLVTDGVFSMDGDIADLPALSRIAQHNGAALMVDDAHGFGVLGERGRGSAELLGVEPEVLVATLGKSLGCAGGFVAGSETLIEYLVQKARTWVFSTAPPPAVAAAARAALRIVRDEPELRARLHANMQRFVDGARERGLPVEERAVLTPIQPVIVYDDARALALSRELMTRGYWIAAIRPPTVPRGTARLRITLSAAHEPEQIDGLLDALADSLRALP
jgi:8-amino-7-oxononanoate synthase